VAANGPGGFLSSRVLGLLTIANIGPTPLVNREWKQAPNPPLPPERATT